MQIPTRILPDQVINTELAKINFTMDSPLETKNHIELAEVLQHIIELESSIIEDEEIVKIFSPANLSNLPEAYKHYNQIKRNSTLRKSQNNIQAAKSAIQVSTYTIINLVEQIQKPKMRIIKNENLFLSHWKTDRLEDTYSADAIRFIKKS